MEGIRILHVRIIIKQKAVLKIIVRGCTNKIGHSSRFVEIFKTWMRG